MKLINHPSPNFSERARGSSIDKLIMHYTGMENAKLSLAHLCDKNSKVSAHYLLDENGRIFQLVSEEKRAWHAGVSYWAGETDINSQSIGIELQNRGHEWGYNDFPKVQIKSLIELVMDIRKRHHIPEKNILGHSDIAPERKQDPGEFFPWEEISFYNIGYWPKLPQKKIELTHSRQATQKNLSLIGYNPETPFSENLKAFQRHYRPSKVDGILDNETAHLIDFIAKDT